MDRNRFMQQMEFIRTIDKMKEIGRQTYLADGSRKENDAEHSWHMAVMALLLSEYATQKVDTGKVMKMLLVHDLVEIFAGDSYAYDPKAQASARARELEAADKLYGMLPKEQGSELRALWDEFEAYETPEATFAHTLDNFQPMLLNDASDGKSWREHQVHQESILNRNKKTAEGSEEIWEYMQELILKNRKKGNILD